MKIDSLKFRLSLTFLAMGTIGFVLGYLFHTPSLKPVPIPSFVLKNAINTAGHGRVKFVQAQTIDGITVAQVRYPDGSLHNVYFFTSGPKIQGFIPQQPVYLPTGKILPVLWKTAKTPTTKTATTAATAAPDGVINNPQNAAPNAVVLKYVHLAHSFVWGKDKNTPIDALVDPNCLFCHKWYKAVKPAVDAGKISFRIVPVAALKKSSVPKAIEILSAKDPLALWLQDEKHFDMATEEGGLPTNLPKTATAKKDVAVNTAILYAIDNHHPFTPTFADTQNGQVLIGKNHEKELQHAFIQKP